MKAIALTMYFAAAFLCTLGADEAAVSKLMHAIGSSAIDGNRAQSLASRAACDIQQLTRCMMTFFGNIGLSYTTLPSGYDVINQFIIQVSQAPPQGFNNTCSYLSALSICAPPTDCWNMNSMGQLNFPDGEQGARGALSVLLPYQYICTNDYQTAVINLNCIIRAQNVPVSCPASGLSCAQIIPDLTCIGNFYSNECNSDVGKMYCHATASYVKAMFPTLCSANELDNACDGGSSFTQFPYSTTPNAGSINDRLSSIVFAIFFALAVTSLKHA